MSIICVFCGDDIDAKYQDNMSNVCGQLECEDCYNEHKNWLSSLSHITNYINEKYLYNNEATDCGYKGGDFKMDGDTPIYIANYGESEVDLNGEYVALKPVGINLKDNNIILVTRKEED